MSVLWFAEVFVVLSAENSRYEGVEYILISYLEILLNHLSCLWLITGICTVFVHKLSHEALILDIFY